MWTEFPDAAGASRVTVPRPEVPAGEEAQVDYGFLGSWQDPATGRVRRVWAFVMVLACSRHMFVRPVLVMDQAAWVAAHVAALGFFGGAPRRVVSDNLKTGVIKPDLYDPKLNRAYAELAAYYGVLIDPARAARPKDNLDDVGEILAQRVDRRPHVAVLVERNRGDDGQAAGDLLALQRVDVAPVDRSARRRLEDLNGRPTASSNSTTYNAPSGPKRRSMIGVNPPSNTSSQSGLGDPHSTPEASGATRQIRDTPVGAGNPVSSPT